MEWTHDEPKEQGFYWLYASWYANEPKLYWVYRLREQAYMRPADMTDNTRKLWPGFQYWWQGPIEPPAPPHVEEETHEH